MTLGNDPPSASGPTPAEVRAALARILSSRCFGQAGRASDFLRFVVEQTLTGHGRNLKGYVIAMAVFGRPADFDAQIDPLVRVEAGRLRRRLAEYYASEGERETLRIALPRGRYTPEWCYTEGPANDAEIRPVSVPAANTHPALRDCFADYYEYRRRPGAEGHAESRHCFESVVARRPELANAWAGLALLDLDTYGSYTGGGLTQGGALLCRARTAIDTAQGLETNNARAAAYWRDGEPEKALEHALLERFRLWRFDPALCDALICGLTAAGALSSSFVPPEGG